MSTVHKILSNTVAQILGKFIVAILGLAVVKITTSYLSQEAYGQYIAIYEFLAFFGIAADLGLFTIAVKEMSEDEEQIPKIIGNILSLRTILVITSLALAIISAFLIPKFAETRIALGVSIASITVFLTIMNGTISSVLQTKLKMEIASITNILGKAVSLGFMAYIVFFGFPQDSEKGFYMLIAAGAIGAAIMFLSTHYYVRKITPIKYQFDLQLWKKVFIKALPYGLALILNTIYFRIDSLLILFLLPEAKAAKEVGIYGVAMKMLEQFAILPLYFMNSVLPTLTKNIKEKSEKYQQIIRHSFDFLAAMSIPLVVGGCILAFPIIFVVSTPEYLSRLAEGFYGSDIAFQILIFALLFQFLNVLFAFILIALDKQSKLLYINAIGVAFNLIANFLLIPEYGFRGAALTSVISELFILIATYRAAKHYLKFTLNFRNLFKITLSSLTMGFAVYFLQAPSYALIQNWNILFLIPFGAATYIAMLFATKTINKDILKLIRK